MIKDVVLVHRIIYLFLDKGQVAEYLKQSGKRLFIHALPSLIYHFHVVFAAADFILVYLHFLWPDTGFVAFW